MSSIGFVFICIKLFDELAVVTVVEGIAETDDDVTIVGVVIGIIGSDEFFVNKLRCIIDSL